MDQEQRLQLLSETRKTSNENKGQYDTIPAAERSDALEQGPDHIERRPPYAHTSQGNSTEKNTYEDFHKLVPYQGWPRMSQDFTICSSQLPTERSQRPMGVYRDSSPSGEFIGKGIGDRGEQW